MADIVNLRLARRRKAREEAKRIAVANRLLHGRTRAEKQQIDASKRAALKRLDGHRLEAPDIE